jgi:predicted ATP-dependent serine protease
MEYNNYTSMLIYTVLNCEGFYQKFYEDLKYYKRLNKTENYIFTSVKEHYEKYNTVPTYQELVKRIETDGERKDSEGNITIHVQFKAILDHLKSILEVNKQTNYQYVIDIFKEQLLDSIENQLQHNTTISKVERKNLLKRLSYYELNEVGSTQVKYLKLSDYNPNEKRDVIKTGIKLIDDCGGIAKGEVGMFVAATGIGKTTLLTSIANKCSTDKNKVVHIVFEGRTNQYMELHLRKMNMSYEEVKEHYINDYLTIIKFEEGATTINDIKNALDTLINKNGGIDVIVIDYIDCIRHTTSTKDFWQGESEVINELENYVVKNNCCLWTAVQTNRSGLNADESDMTQIAGSKKKLDKASMVVFLSRNREQMNIGVATMKIMKNRNGFKEEARNFTYNPHDMIINTDDIITL